MPSKTHVTRHLHRFNAEIALLSLAVGTVATVLALLLSH
jgi:hypothetical protein